MMLDFQRNATGAGLRVGAGSGLGRFGRPGLGNGAHVPSAGLPVALEHLPGPGPWGPPEQRPSREGRNIHLLPAGYLPSREPRLTVVCYGPPSVFAWEPFPLKNSNQGILFPGVSAAVPATTPVTTLAATCRPRLPVPVPALLRRHRLGRRLRGRPPSRRRRCRRGCRRG